MVPCPSHTLKIQQSKIVHLFVWCIFPPGGVEQVVAVVVAGVVVEMTGAS